MDLSNICGHTNWNYCFYTEYFPNNETKRDDAYTPPSGHVTAGLDHPDLRTSSNPSANEASKAVLVTSVLADPRWAAYDRQGGDCRLEQTVYLEVATIPT